jgi:predicted MFS family arabinose efflux permease
MMKLARLVLTAAALSMSLPAALSAAPQASSVLQIDSGPVRGVAWTTWLTRTVPDETESGGGLQVAAIQLAITAGAGAGGILLDVTGTAGAFIGSGITLLAAGLILVGLRSRPRPSLRDAPHHQAHPPLLRPFHTS